MSNTVFNIAKADILTKLIGKEADRALLDHQLQTLLRNVVLPSVAEQLNDILAEDTILCLPNIQLHCQMSLEEALSGKGASQWVEQLIHTIVTHLNQGHGIVQFHNRWHFIASYLLQRLTLNDFSETIFDDIGPLALLTPRQAWLEAFRMWPEVWPWLAPNDLYQAHRICQSLQSQGGEVVIHELFITAFDAERETLQSTALHEWLTRLENLSRLPAMSALAKDLLYQSNSITEGSFIAGLYLAPDLHEFPLHSGCVIAILVSLADKHSDRLKSSSVILSLSRKTLKHVPASIKHRVENALVMLDQSKASRRVLMTLVESINNSLLNSQTKDPSRTKPHDVISTVDIRKNINESTNNQQRIVYSPIAGLGLLMPYLSENRMARSFPARVRLAALSQLAIGGPVAFPEKDPLLLAIAGTDTSAHEKPDQPRPSEMDLLFVSTHHREAIKSLSDDVSQLARWLEARFAASLPGLSSASRSFLAKHFWYQHGSLTLSEDHAVLELESLPLKIVLQMSGCIGESLCQLDWLQQQILNIHIKESL